MEKQFNFPSPFQLFISDLHLESPQQESARLFVEFLTAYAKDAESLYILGDLFESWVGDDDNCEIGHVVKEHLSLLTKQGVNGYFLPGNRDFLVGESFCKDANITLIDEPYLIDLYGTKAVLMHGDILCIDDVKYQAFRTQVRNTKWQQQFLSQPLEQRLLMAKQAREQSKQHTQENLEIMDVNDDEVRKVFTDHSIDLLIHGHTHRLNIHDYQINNKNVKRIVLGDWHKTGNALAIWEGGYKLFSFE